MAIEALVAPTLHVVYSLLLAKSMKIQMRFNTDSMKFPERNLPAWRVLLDGKEILAREVSIRVSSWTTTDTLEGGIIKYHITCEGTPVWQGEHLTIQ